ncbi:ABC transporter substrate-binding protein [Leifsonia sp. NPDC058194]|uniref:ABC transporter substrate-binding protein n=1 Tax=Leifsonia sp. NPDC058194 TaxID=3346374 RepID=UPI0036D77EEC
MTQQSRIGRRKRLLTVAAVAAAVALGLSACSGSGSTSTASYDPEAPVTLSLYNQTAIGNTSPIDTIVADYEKLHPNVKINVNLTPVASYAQVLQTQFQAGNGPDIFWATSGAGDTSGILAFAKGGYVLPMNDYDWATKSVPSNAKDLFVADGKQYGIPIDMVPVGTIYNLTALKAAGFDAPATSLPDLYDQCSAVKEKGKTLFNLAAAAGPNAGIFVMSVAASAVYGQDPKWNSERASGKVTFADSKEWQNTLQIILDLQKKGCFQDGVEAGTIAQLFPAVASGDAMALAAPAGATTDLHNLVADNQYKVSAFPGKTESDTRVFSSPTNALGVNAASKHKDAALAFLKYMTDPKVADKYAGLTGNASMTTVTSGTFPDEFSLIAPYLKDQDKYFPLANLLWPNASVYTALQTGVQGLLTGQASIKQVLESMDSAWGPTK